MGTRFASSGYAGRFQADIRTLTARRNNGGGSFGERLVALDRIAGSTLIFGILCIAVWAVGQASPMTLLEPASATASQSPPSLGLLTPEGVPLTGADVRQLQSRLQMLGFNPGRIDGIVGGRTLDALNHYRATKDLDRVYSVDRAAVADLLD